VERAPRDRRPRRQRPPDQRHGERRGVERPSRRSRTRPFPHHDARPRRWGDIRCDG
jgi:hypothetical protein